MEMGRLTRDERSDEKWMRALLGMVQSQNCRFTCAVHIATLLTVSIVCEKSINPLTLPTLSSRVQNVSSRFLHSRCFHPKTSECS